MSEWAKEWPQEPGWFWFYGKTSRASEDRLMAARVWKAGDGLCYIVGGFFAYQSEATGVWCPMVVPKLPTEEVSE